MALYDNIYFNQYQQAQLHVLFYNVVYFCNLHNDYDFL